MKDEKKAYTKEELDALTGLAEALMAAKAVEASAKQTRMMMEAKLDSLIPGPQEGQKTITLPGGVKLTVTRGLSYKADAAKILDMGIWEGIGISAPVRSKSEWELDIVGYKWYKENRPAEFKMISEHVEVKPKKTSVTAKAAAKKKDK